LGDLRDLFGKSSISDIEKYRMLCKSAAYRESVFSNFRIRRIYTRIVEGVRIDIGKRCLDWIVENHPEMVDRFNEFRKNDDNGGPRLYDYGKYGSFASITLRYIKVLCDLVDLYGSLDGMDIVEIGSGYGGQCRIISSVFDFNSYTMIDLEESLMLVRRYLSKYGTKRTNLIQANSVPEIRSDLLISNYAFSECRRFIQRMYLEKLILPSVKGYMTMNFINGKESFTSFKREDLVRLIPNVFENSEHPISHIENIVLTWDRTLSPLIKIDR